MQGTQILVLGTLVFVIVTVTDGNKAMTSDTKEIHMLIVLMQILLFDKNCSVVKKFNILMCVNTDVYCKNLQYIVMYLKFTETFVIFGFAVMFLAISSFFSEQGNLLHVKEVS